jgi:hypothetical protein
MLDTYLNRGDAEFLGMIFSQQFINTLTTYKNWNGLIKENLGTLSELCYFHDWNKWSKRTNKYCNELGMIGRTRWADPVLRQRGPRVADVPPGWADAAAVPRYQDFVAPAAAIRQAGGAAGVEDFWGRQPVRVRLTDDGN